MVQGVGCEVLGWKISPLIPLHRPLASPLFLGGGGFGFED